MSVQTQRSPLISQESNALYSKNNHTDKYQVSEEVSCMVCTKTTRVGVFSDCKCPNCLQPGDHVVRDMCFEGSPVKHHAIVKNITNIGDFGKTADIEVIQIPRKNYDSNLIVQSETWESIRNYKIGRVTYRQNPYHQKNTLRNAEEALGETVNGDYHLLVRNCEHFALTMVCGTTSGNKNQNNENKSPINEDQPSTSTGLTQKIHTPVSTNDDYPSTSRVLTEKGKPYLPKNDNQARHSRVLTVTEHTSVVTNDDCTSTTSKSSETCNLTRCLRFFICCCFHVIFCCRRCCCKRKGTLGLEKASSLQSVRCIWVLFHFFTSAAVGGFFYLNYYIYEESTKGDFENNTVPCLVRVCKTGLNIRGLTTWCDWLLLLSVICVYTVGFFSYLCCYKELDYICSQCKAAAIVVLITKMFCFFAFGVVTIFTEKWTYILTLNTHKSAKIFVTILLVLIDMFIALFLAPYCIAKHVLIRYCCTTIDPNSYCGKQCCCSFKERDKTPFYYLCYLLSFKFICGAYQGGACKKYTFDGDSYKYVTHYA